MNTASSPFLTVLIKIQCFLWMARRVREVQFDIEQYNLMKKIGAEIRYDNAYQTALVEMELVRKKPIKDRFDSVRQLLKEMDKSIAKIEQDFFGNSKINKKDAENKVNMYRNQKKALKEALDTEEVIFNQKQLMKHKTTQKATPTNKLQQQNLEFAQQQAEQIKNAHRKLIQAKNLTKDTVAEVNAQQEVMKDINQKVEQADGQLTMITQFMDIISNRNLLTKIILLALVIFLGVADLIIIMLKIA